jgi:hypothetical protein
MTYSSSESQYQHSDSTLDSTQCIAVKDEWTGFEGSSAMCSACACAALHYWLNTCPYVAYVYACVDDKIPDSTFQEDKIEIALVLRRHHQT